MKVLLTGATGFVGSHLSQKLEASGHEVYSLCRSAQKFKDFAVGGTMIQGHLNHNHDHQWVEKLPDDLEAVIHTAGVVHSFSSEKFFQTNFQATENLIHDLKNQFPTLKFIFISSLAASGPAVENQPLLETDETNPVSNYGHSKLQAEKALLNEAPTRWQKVIIRPPMVIGPRDPAIVDVFQMVKSKVIMAPGKTGLSNRYSFICVYDLANLIQAALEKDLQTEKQVYFASHPQIVTYGEIVENIEKLLGAKQTLKLQVPIILIRALAFLMASLKKVFPQSDFRLTPDKTYELREKAWLCSGEKSTRELDHTYQWDLERTLEKTYQDYLKRGWI